VFWKRTVSRVTSILMEHVKGILEISTRVTITTDFTARNKKCYTIVYIQSCVKILNASPALTLTASIIHYDKVNPTTDMELRNVRNY
jgi:hypothetical protein